MNGGDLAKDKGKEKYTSGTFGIKFTIETLITYMFKHEMQMKMYHFQTEKYGAHKASDDYITKFRANSDRFLEVAQGLLGKSKERSLTILFNTKDDSSICQCLDDFIASMRLLEVTFATNYEMLNLRDEMIADAIQLKYLLTFK